jgi:hypothetical protein
MPLKLRIHAQLRPVHLLYFPALQAARGRLHDGSSMLKWSQIPSMWCLAQVVSNPDNSLVFRCDGVALWPTRSFCTLGWRPVSPGMHCTNILASTDAEMC